MINTNQDYLVSYAQNHEDILLSGYLTTVDNGFYVDIGANHPVNDSVTNYFYKKGWRGINIEPIVPLYELLKVSRPRDINLNIGVGSSAEQKTLRYYKDKSGLSTFSEEMREEYDNSYEDMGEHVDVKVKIKPLKDILRKHAAGEIHFMKIDVEGFEYEVLAGNDWKKYRPWVLCIESNHIIQPWEDILEKNQYTQVFFDGLNKYFVAKEHQYIANDFSYPRTMLAKPVLSPNIETAFLKERKDKERATREIDNIRADWNRLSTKVDQLEDELRNARRLKGSIKQLLKAIDNVIAVRINNLDKPNTRTDLPKINTESVTTPKALLTTVHQYDFDKYYSTSSSQRFSYRLAHNLHQAVTKRPIRAYRKLRLKAKNRKG